MSEPTHTFPASPPTVPAGDGTNTADGITLAPVGGPSTAVFTPSGYELLDEVGRGAMGVVYRARDLGIGRDVAVKLLQDRFPADSTTARRFLDEARITGQLQHPGIPAVHQIGTLPNGRPFLAMKLIKGQTLDAMLREKGAGSTKWLGVFEGVCQAVGYAHAHGVIHRDLKPGNVMVGAFGEVQVMDWGLAKLLASGGCQPPGSPEDADATATLGTEIHSLRDADLLTQHGSILGTPAFMAPEQAIGALDQIDRRTDVFGLGATLCSLLTGKPPFVGDTAESTRQMAARAKVDDAFARLDSCAAEPDLIALCKRCLNAGPKDRPADASEVARAVAALRAAADDRARKAEIDREKAEVESREQRKRRRVVQWAGGAVAGVLLAGVVGTTVGLLQAQDAKRRETERADGETKAKGEAVVAKINAEAAARAESVAKVQERMQRANAETAYAKAAAVLDLMVSDVTGDALTTQNLITAAQKKFLAEALKYYKEIAELGGVDENSRKRTARAAIQVGVIEYRLGRKRESAETFRHACDEYQTLVAAYPAVPQYRQELAGSHTNLGILLKGLGNLSGAIEQYTKAIDVQEKLAINFPTIPEYRLNLARTRIGLGMVLTDLGKCVDAEKQFRWVVTHLHQFSIDFPAESDYLQDLADSHTSLGQLLILGGDWREGEKRFREALAIRQRLTDQRPRDPDRRDGLAAAHMNLGNTLTELREWSEAEEQYKKAMSIREKLATGFPSAQGFQVSLGGVYCNLGKLKRVRGGSADSVIWFEKAIDILRPLHRNEPRDVTIKLFLRNAHWERALAYDQVRQHSAADKDWDRAAELSSGAEKLQLRALRANSKLSAGQVKEAVVEVNRLRALPEWRAGELYLFARVYSLASTEIVNEKQEYADAAMEMLQKAVKAGYKEAAHMKADPDLDPLRDRDDFKKLLAELEAKFPPKREVLPAPRKE